MFTPKKFTETAKDCKTCKTFFLSSLTVGQNKLECFFLPSFRQVCNIWVRLYPWQALMLFDQMHQTWPTKNFPGTLHLILTKNQWQKKFCYVRTLTFMLPQLATIYAAISKLACSIKKTFWTSWSKLFNRSSIKPLLVLAITLLKIFWNERMFEVTRVQICLPLSFDSSGTILHSSIEVERRRLGRYREIG